MAENTHEDKDAKAAARQEFRMQLDQVLSDLKSEINVEVSNKIREGMSRETNIDASKNVEVNVGAPAPAAAPAKADDDEKAKSYPKRK